MKLFRNYDFKYIMIEDRGSQTPKRTLILSWRALWSARAIES